MDKYLIAVFQGEKAYVCVCVHIDIFLLYVSSEVKVTQSCLTLCDPMAYIVHEILQARILEWVAFPFSRVSSQSRDQTQVSRLREDSLPAEPQG